MEAPGEPRTDLHAPGIPGRGRDSELSTALQRSRQDFSLGILPDFQQMLGEYGSAKSFVHAEDSFGGMIWRSQDLNQGSRRLFWGQRSG